MGLPEEFFNPRAVTTVLSFRQPPKRNNPHLDFVPQFLLVLGTTGVFIAVVYVVYMTSEAEYISRKQVQLPLRLQLPFNTTLTIVTILQGLLAAGASLAFGRTWLCIQWALVARVHGVSYPTFLALSPTTLDWGAIQLVFNYHSTLPARSWAIARVSFLGMLWVSGVILLVKTDLVTVYDTVYKYPVTAGVGEFNASYVQPFFDRLQADAQGYNFTVLPYAYWGSASNLATNPEISTMVDPVECQQQEENPDCAAFLLSDGLVGITPYIAEGYPGHPLVRINRVTSIQVEFDTATRDSDRDFAEDECTLFRANYTIISTKLCLALTDTGSIEAAIYSCGSGEDGRFCERKNGSDIEFPHLATKVSFFKRTATIVGSKANLTITSVSDLSDPVKVTNIDLQAFGAVLHWVLDFQAADIPAPSSLTSIFWGQSNDNVLSNPYLRSIKLQSFRNLLVFPFHLFNANNWGNVDLKQNEIVDTLPPEFYTEAAIVKPYPKLKFDSRIAAAFIALQAIALMFIWVVVVWTCAMAAHLPAISSFPLFDAAFKCEVNIDGDRVDKTAWEADDPDILRMLSRAGVLGRID